VAAVFLTVGRVEQHEIAAESDCWVVQPEPRHAEDEVVRDRSDVEAEGFLVGRSAEEDGIVFGDSSSPRGGAVG